MRDMSCNYVIGFNIFKFCWENRRVSYLYRPLKLGKSSSSWTLPESPGSGYFRQSLPARATAACKLAANHLGREKFTAGREGKLSEFTPTNYNRPSHSITVQTLYRKPERGCVRREWRWTEERGRAGKCWNYPVVLRNAMQWELYPQMQLKWSFRLQIYRIFYL